MNKPLNIQYETLTQLFINREHEMEKGISFILNNKEETFYSYHSIFQHAKQILGFLQSKGLKPKDKLVIRLQDNREFIFTFWACVIGGIIPVPIVAEEIDEYRRKLFKVLETLEDGWLIGESNRLNSLEEFAEKNDFDLELVKGRFLDVEEALSFSQPGEIFLDSLPSDTAFIQFSSGSTGLPKGVVLTHRNLITNIDAIIDGTNLHENDVIVSWMPLTHDMGLIGNHLTTTAANMMQYSMSTLLFVRRPGLWLEKVSTHQATIITSPNFGLDYSAKALAKSKFDFDFSSVRIIINGAEPISIQACKSFLEKTAVYGMRPNVMFPVYGMAEATLAVAFPPLHEEIHSIQVDLQSLKVGKQIQFVQENMKLNSSQYVDEGYAVKNCQIRICDAEDHLLGEDYLGIIQIQGPNVTDGYYQNPQANHEAFTQDGWLRTGDIGFFHQERLIVVGRQKEMLILNGQNYFPDDLERIAAEVDSIDENKIVITSCKDRKTNADKVVAFVVHKGKMETFIPKMIALKAHISKSSGVALDHMIPVPKIPKTSSGKPVRFKLREEYETGDYETVLEQCKGLLNKAQHEQVALKEKENPRIPIEQVSTEILTICREVAPDIHLGLYDHFFDYGVNSLLLNQIAARLEEIYGMDIPNEAFFKYPNVKQLAGYICGGDKQEQRNPEATKSKRIKANEQMDDVAIIGMAATLPGANNIREFWGNLCGGVESVGPLPYQRRKVLEAYLESKGHPVTNQPSHAGYLYEIDTFDYKFFKILKKEAIAMSPAQRLFLQTAYSSLEDAGYGGDALRTSNTGVYVGYISDLDGAKYQEVLAYSTESQTATGMLSANISGRVSYFMDFKGPSINVDTACSSSMSALSLACSAIQNGECDQAIVGGVEIKAVPMNQKEKVGIESSDGHTRPFADESDGTGVGEGVVSILIKPYKQALADRDHIYSVIRSISINQDGYSVGISAPNPIAQAELVKTALEKAGLEAEDISYIEAHGTGTQLGDPIEISALTDAFRSTTSESQFCAIGSVKSNINHLYAASGLASIVKTSMMLKHKKIPATINIRNLHSKIHFKETPFYVNQEYKHWMTEKTPRRAGVSNFGFSGTNVHAILEEFMEERTSLLEDKAYPIVLSAKTKSELGDLVNTYRDFLSMNEDVKLVDLSYTLAIGRGHYPYRLAFSASNINEVIEKLERYEFKTNVIENRYIGKVNITEGFQQKKAWGELTLEDKETLNHGTLTLLSENGKEHIKLQRETLLARICSLYVRGSDPIWTGLFEKEPYRRTSLPTYPFMNTRCWPKQINERLIENV